MAVPVFFAVSNIFIPGCYQRVRDRLAARVRSELLHAYNTTKKGHLSAKPDDAKAAAAAAAEQQPNCLVRFWYRVSPDLPVVALGCVWATFLLRLSTATAAEQGDVDWLPAVQFKSQRSVLLRLQGERDAHHSSEEQQATAATAVGAPDESDATEKGDREKRRRR
jgi:hypothetical protein